MPPRPDPPREVLTSLPRSRPARRSAKRDGGAGGRRAAGGAAATAKRSGAVQKRAAKPKIGGAAGASASGAVRTASVPRPAGRRARPVAEPTGATPRRPIPPAGYAAPDERSGQSSAAASAELIGTTIQATAELAQIGLTVGRQTLRSMLERLPRP